MNREGSDVEIPKFNVSYRPQKISPKFQSTVRHLLHQKIRDSYMHPQFVSDVMKPLLIEQLMDQEVVNLSGGELHYVYALERPLTHYKRASRGNSFSPGRLTKVFVLFIFCLVMAFPPPPAGPSGAQFWPPVSIVGPQYCVPYPVDISVVSKLLPISDGSFFVRDMNDRVIFNVRGRGLELAFGLGFDLQDRRILIDAVGNPIVTLRREFMSFCDRWEAFRGRSTFRSDLIFTVERSSVLQLKPELDVFLANSKRKNACDFKVEGSWFDRSCEVYAGESSRIVAQMHKTVTLESALLRQDLFRATIYPNIDYAFIVLLTVIFVGIYKKKDD